MTNLFIIQLITSFLVGGAFIALLSFVAEKVNEKISGIILTLPSTAALGFFFMGWTLSPQAVADIIPTTLVSLGVGVLFVVIYLYAAHLLGKLKISKYLQILFSFLVSMLYWLMLSVPIAIARFSNLFWGIIIYGLLTITSHVLLHRKKQTQQKVQLIKYALFQKFGRAIFVGFVVLIIVFVSKTVNKFWGGIFAMFPAAFFSTMVIFHWYYNQENLLPIVKKIPLGSLSLLIYALVAMYTFPVIGFVWGTLISYSASLITSLFLIKIQNKKIPIS